MVREHGLCAVFKTWRTVLGSREPATARIFTFMHVTMLLNFFDELWRRIPVNK
jgi:hypothetical protein